MTYWPKGMLAQDLSLARIEGKRKIVEKRTVKILLLIDSKLYKTKLLGQL